MQHESVLHDRKSSLQWEQLHRRRRSRQGQEGFSWPGCATALPVLVQGHEFQPPGREDEEAESESHFRCLRSMESCRLLALACSFLTACVSQVPQQDARGRLVGRKRLGPCFCEVSQEQSPSAPPAAGDLTDPGEKTRKRNLGCTSIRTLAPVESLVIVIAWFGLYR